MIQPSSGKSVLNALDTLFPETRKKAVLNTSQRGASGAVSTSCVFKPPGRGKQAEIKFSDDNVNGSAARRGPSTLETIDSIRSPSPDFDFDDMDDLIRAAPDSALDADNFDTAVDLILDGVEEVPSPPDVPQSTRKRLRDSPPGPDPAVKRMKKNSDWQGNTNRSRFRPVRSDSVQEVGASSTEQ